MSAVYTIGAYPKEMALRDGRQVIIKPMEAEDAQALLDFFLAVPEEERFFLKEDVTSPKVVSEWAEHLDYRRALPLLAWAEGKVVANAVLVRRRGNARSHIGELRVVVAPDYRGCGLGTLLMRELCDLADDAGLQRVVLEVVADKEKEALQAAEWMGFLRTATIESGAIDQDGRLHSVIILSMPLGKWYEWTKF